MVGKTGRKTPVVVVEVAHSSEEDVGGSGMNAQETMSPQSTLSAISVLPSSALLTTGQLSSAASSAAVVPPGLGLGETPAASKAPPEPEKNLWQQICAEYEAEQPPFPEGYKVKQPPVITVSSPLEATVFQGLSTESFFQVTQNYAIVQDVPCVAPEAPEVFDPKTCSPREYLENFIFPVLLPGMANLLHQAKKEECFERKKTKFIACDYLTEWLYNPRASIPLSLLLSEDKATLIIQSFWRGYLVRCEPEIQELRQWQKQLREDNHIRQRVKEFWTKQEKKCQSLPDSESSCLFSNNSITLLPTPERFFFLSGIQRVIHTALIFFGPQMLQLGND
ncbi:IQ domain-containing protein K isoform X2 [Macrotis lagotis]|uniref:IQ domain-containing protein K isoform X2 n=1 Tax=Macrotis lagotis TaxID=92651 RepID=UPI003D68DEEE